MGLKHNLFNAETVQVNLIVLFFELCLASFTIYVFSVQSQGGIQLLHGQAVVWLAAQTTRGHAGKENF